MKYKIIATVGVIVVSGLFFILTNPENLPVAALMIPILLAFGVVTIASGLVFHILKSFRGDQRRQKSVAVLCGVVAASLLVFQSTGGIVVTDVILLGLIFFVGALYIIKY